jgi:hypothetical protein
VEHEKVRRTVVPQGLPSVFDDLRGGASYYLGEMEERPGNEMLLQGLGGAQPEAVLLVPVPFQDRIIAVLYGDAPARDLMKVDVRALRTLTRKAGLAMELLLLKHRIQQ